MAVLHGGVGARVRRLVARLVARSQRPFQQLPTSERFRGAPISLTSSAPDATGTISAALEPALPMAGTAGGRSGWRSEPGGLSPRCRGARTSSTSSSSAPTTSSTPRRGSRRSPTAGTGGGTSMATGPRTTPASRASAGARIPRRVRRRSRRAGVHRGLESREPMGLAGGRWAADPSCGLARSDSSFGPTRPTACRGRSSPR